MNYIKIEYIGVGDYPLDEVLRLLMTQDHRYSSFVLHWLRARVMGLIFGFTARYAMAETANPGRMPKEA